MYKTIVNPITNRKVNINTKLGQKIITNYLRNFNHSQMKGGGYLRVDTVDCIGNRDEDGYYLCPITMEPLDEYNYLQTPNGTCYSRFALCAWLQHLERHGKHYLTPFREPLTRQWVQDNCPDFEFDDNDDDVEDDYEEYDEMDESGYEDRANDEADEAGDYGVDYNEEEEEEEEEDDWEPTVEEAQAWWRKHIDGEDTDSSSDEDSNNGGEGTSGAHDDNGGEGTSGAHHDQFWQGQWPVIYDEHGTEDEPVPDQFCPIVTITESLGDGYYEIEFNNSWGEFDNGDRTIVHEDSLRLPTDANEYDGQMDEDHYDMDESW